MLQHCREVQAGNRSLGYTYEMSHTYGNVSPPFISSLYVHRVHILSLLIHYCFKRVQSMLRTLMQSYTLFINIWRFVHRNSRNEFKFYNFRPASVHCRSFCDEYNGDLQFKVIFTGWLQITILLVRKSISRLCYDVLEVFNYFFGLAMLYMQNPVVFRRSRASRLYLVKILIRYGDEL